MNYKALFTRLKNMIVAPQKEWEQVSKEELTGLNVVNEFALPFIGMGAAAAFLGTAIFLKGFNIEESLKKAILVFCSLYFSLYLSMGVIYLFMDKFQLEKNRDRVFKFVGYASSVIFAVKFVTELFPELFFLKIITLYTAYIIWEGVGPIFKISEQQKAAFVVLCSVILIAGNYFVFKLLHLLLPGV